MSDTPNFMTETQERLNKAQIEAENAQAELRLARRAIRDLERDLGQLRAEREEAASELLINIDEAPPGSVAGKLMVANQIMRRQRDEARAQLIAIRKGADPCWGEESDE